MRQNNVNIKTFKIFKKKLMFFELAYYIKLEY